MHHTQSGTKSSTVLSILALLLIGGLIGTGFAHMPLVDKSEALHT